MSDHPSESSSRPGHPRLRAVATHDDRAPAIEALLTPLGPRHAKRITSKIRAAVAKRDLRFPRPAVLAALLLLLRARMDEPEVVTLYEQLLLTACDRTQPEVILLDVDTIAQLTCDEARLLGALLPLDVPTPGVLVSLAPVGPGERPDPSRRTDTTPRCAALFALGHGAQLRCPERTASYIAELTKLGITRVRRSSWDRHVDLLRSAELHAWLESLGEGECGVSLVPLELELTDYGAHLMRSSFSAAAEAERRRGRDRRRARLQLVDG
jgi:hypothetical protein